MPVFHFFDDETQMWVAVSGAFVLCENCICLTLISPMELSDTLAAKCYVHLLVQLCLCLSLYSVQTDRHQLPAAPGNTKQWRVNWNSVRWEKREGQTTVLCEFVPTISLFNVQVSIQSIVD